MTVCCRGVGVNYRTGGSGVLPEPIIEAELKSDFWKKKGEGKKVAVAC